MKFAKNLVKVENWCKKNGFNIDRMKSDTYMYQVYTCVDDCLYIEQVNYLFILFLIFFQKNTCN